MIGYMGESKTSVSVDKTIFELNTRKLQVVNSLCLNIIAIAYDMIECIFE